DAIYPLPLDCRLALQLQTKLDKERDRAYEVVDNDEHVVHPLDRHVLKHRDPGHSGSTDRVDRKGLATGATEPFGVGRGGERIRTADLSRARRALYRSELHPRITRKRSRGLQGGSELPDVVAQQHEPRVRGEVAGRDIGA